MRVHVGPATGTGRAGTSDDEPPLSGVKVLDLSTSYAGPTATMYLADLGADVIKVERPGTGDDARSWGPPFVDDVSAWFASANRNKRSIVIDLRQPEGQALLYELLGKTNVVVESFNPIKLRQLGLSPEEVCARFPRLIFCALSGFGLTGPDAKLPGYDLIAQARSGIMSVTGERGRSPQRVSTALSDVVAGLAAALAVTAALRRQERTGRGELIDVSLLEAALALMAPRIASYLAGEAEPQPSSATDSVLAIYQTFATGDGSVAIAIGNGAIWQRFCEAAGLADLGKDSRLRDNHGRRRHRDTIVRAISETVARRTTKYWVDKLSAAGVPVAPVQSLGTVLTDPHVVAREAIVPLIAEGQLYGVRSPWRLRSHPDVPRRAVPSLGAHTQEVLAEAGMDPLSIEELRRAGAFGTVGSEEGAT